MGQRKESLDKALKRKLAVESTLVNSLETAVDTPITPLLGTGAGGAVAPHPKDAPVLQRLVKAADGRRLVNRAVVKALTVLEHLLAYKLGRTLMQLAEDLKLPVSSVSDIIKTLVKLGYLEFDSESRRYLLTPKLMDLGQTYLHQTGLYTVSVPVVGELSKKFNCVAAVYQFDRGARKLLLIAEEGGAPHLRFGWQIGSAILHCSAPGKVVLASLTSDEAAEILNGVGMPQLTAHTITNLDDLQRDLALVRKRGYALDNQETFLGIGCIAIPIMVDRASIACLTLRMPIERLVPDFVTGSIEFLLNTGAAIANGVARTKSRTT